MKKIGRKIGWAEWNSKAAEVAQRGFGRRVDFRSAGEYALGQSIYCAWVMSDRY